MIVILEGIPGSGKSYSAVKDFVVPAIKAGRKIYTNIDGLDAGAIAIYLKLEEDYVTNLIHYVSEDQSDFWSVDILDVDEDSLLLIDEAHTFYCSRDFSKFSAEVRDFYAMHRHHGLDIVLMSQTAESIDKWIRVRAEKFIRYKKMTIINMPSRYMTITINPTDGSVLSRKMQKYESWVFNLYTSFTPSSTLKAFEGSKTTGPIKKMITYVSLLVFFFGVGIYVLSDTASKVSNATSHTRNLTMNNVDTLDYTSKIDSPSSSRKPSYQNYSSPPDVSRIVFRIKAIKMNGIGNRAFLLLSDIYDDKVNYTSLELGITPIQINNDYVEIQEDKVRLSGLGYYMPAYNSPITTLFKLVRDSKTVRTIEDVRNKPKATESKVVSTGL